MISGDMQRDALPISRSFGPIWLIAAILALICCVAAGIGGFSFDVVALAPPFAMLAILSFCGVRLNSHGHVRIADSLQISTLFYVMVSLTALSCSALTATNLPYADAALAATDRAVGFDWMAMHRWFRDAPVAAKLLISAYGALDWTPQLLIFCLCAFRARGEAFCFLAAWAIALLLTVAIFPLFPAIAAFHHYGLTPHMMPGPTAVASWQLPDIMDALRSGKDRVLGMDELTGIVTMPSFHAAGAILLMHFYWTFRWLRLPSTVITGAMFLSAVPVGGYYLVDIFAGMAVAVLSIMIARMVYSNQRGRSGVNAPALAHA